jgi:hypothetical protein
MTDLASLGIQIDSTQVPKAVGDLDKLTAAGGRAEGATERLTTSTKSASAAAAQFAANAQTMARNATLTGSGLTSMGKATGLAAYQAQNLAFQLNDVATGLASGQAPMRVLAQQSGQFVQIMQQSGLGVRGFATALLEMVGILKVTRDAELAEEAANAAAAATAIKSSVDRAKANIAAADTEIELALAAQRQAVTATQAAAASERLARAHAAQAAAAGEAAIAEDALAVASRRSATAATASAAATRVALGPMAGILTGVAVATGLVVGGFKVFQAQVRDSGTLDKYANSLGLTKKEMKELRQEVGGLSSKEMQDLDARARAFEITWGDVFNGVKKAASDALDLSPAWNKFKSDAEKAFADVLHSAVSFASKLYGIWNTVVANAPKITMGPIPHFEAGTALSADEFWKQVGDRAADAQKKISKNLETIRSNIISAAEQRIKNAADSIIEDRSTKKPKKQSDHGLADALAQLDAQIKGQYALAAAYQVSDAAAIKAEALQKAEEEAIRHKGEVGIFYEKELALAVAKRTADGAKTIADLRFEADSRQAVNAQVAAGLIPAAKAGEALELEAKLRPLTAAAAASEGKAKALLVDIIRSLTKAYEANNEQIERAQVLQATASGQDQIAQLKLEATLIGQTNAARAVAIAQLQAQQFLRDHPGASPEEAQAYIQTQVQIAQLTADLATAQDNYNSSLAYTGDLLRTIGEQAGELRNVLSDAFGGIGDSIGSAITSLTGYLEQEQSIADWKREETTKAGGDANRLAQIEILASKKSATARMQATGQMLGALKGLFKEHSTGYKVMTAIEKAYAAFQAVQTALAIARDIAHTASSLANSATRTTANTAEGGSKLFAQLGVWAFPVVAAMVAVIAALGFKGGGGGGGGAAIPNVDDLQAAQGAGTVLGDSKAKSESIAHSLEIVAANTNKDLEYTNEMLRTLRNIDVGISKLAGTIAQEIQVGNLFDTSGLNLGTTGSKGFLGIGAKSVTRTLADQGIVISGSPLHLASHYKNQALWNAAMAQVTGASVASILANGLYGASYTRTDEQRTSGGVLGIGGGSSTGVDYDTGPLSNTITNLFVQVIGSMRDSILAASKVVGLDGAQALIDAFQVKIGQISFEGMTGDQIEDQLNAIFSSIGDQMAGAVFPALKAMQKVGEGLLETFMRVAREYQVVDVELQSIGKTFGMTGVASIAARDALIQLFGSVDDFVSQTDFFKEQFLSDAEQVAPIQSAVIAELQRLGVSGVTTRDQFKQLVLGLDLTTDAGRQMYASLLAVAPAFDKVLDYFDQLNKKQIETLQSTIDQFNKFTDSLKKYRDTLFASDATQGNAYNVLKSRFIATANLAATGDATALGGLQQSGQDFLTAARNNASTLQQYLRDVALVARGVDNGIAASEDAADYAQLQLDALRNATSILQQINANTQATAAALTQPVVAQPTSAPPVVYSSTTETSVPVVEDQNARIIQQNDTIIDLLTKQQRLFTKFDGDGLLVRTDSDTPLNVVTS